MCRSSRFIKRANEYLISEDNADCPFMMSAIGDDCRNKSEGKDITYTAEYLVNWTKGKLFV